MKMYLSCSLCECCDSQSAAFADVLLLSIHLNSVVAAWHLNPSPWTVGSTQRKVEFPAACKSPFSSFQLSTKNVKLESFAGQFMDRQISSFSSRKQSNCPGIHK
jgi:hypothetical protein